MTGEQYENFVDEFMKACVKRLDPITRKETGHCLCFDSASPKPRERRRATIIFFVMIQHGQTGTIHKGRTDEEESGL